MTKLNLVNSKNRSQSSGLRPDRNKQFVVAECGEIQDGELPIFVDLDVLRDMEAHARENTRVELGGVMLGRQHTDLEGVPYVVITDSLRARHYEATKGSFKFTHDTWNQITRERNEFHDDLEMVGWYHTHPGWGIFLSGMDLFICNNFFNRPLDVALVIDPCAGDRGWFQWSNEEPDKTEQTGGFYLMTNRHRSSELNYFSEFFSGQCPRIPDPRFNRPGFVEHANANSPTEHDMVNVIDDRRGVFEFAILSMLFLQLLVVGLIGWRLTKTETETSQSKVDERINLVEQRLADNEFRTNASIREQAFAEVLSAITSQSGQEDLARKFASVAEQNLQLNESLKDQRSRIQLEEMKRIKAANELALKDREMTSLKVDLKSAVAALDKSEADVKALESELGVSAEDVAARIPNWVWYSLGSAALVVFGGFAGFFVNRIFVVDDEVDVRHDSEPNDSGDQQPSVNSFAIAESKSAISSNVD